MKPVHYKEQRLFDKEFEFISSRSSGPGGQHVNRTNTKVELRFHIQKSALLTETEKQILTKELQNRINGEGFLQIVSQKHRSRLQNQRECVRIFHDLLRKALAPKKKRIKTKASRSSVLKRLNEKRINAEKKKLRRKDNF